MTLNREDYSNILKLLEGVEIKGVQSAKYVAVLAHKIENRVATWFDGHVTGFRQEPVTKAQAPSGYQVQDLAKEIPEPPVELN